MLAPTRGCFLGGIYCKETHTGAGTWVLPRGNIWSKITLPAHPPAEVADEVAGVYPGAPRTLQDVSRTLQDVRQTLQDVPRMLQDVPRTLQGMPQTLQHGIWDL